MSSQSERGSTARKAKPKQLAASGNEDKKD